MGNYKRSLRKRYAFHTIGEESAWSDMLGSITTSAVAGANVPTWSTFRDSISGYAFSASALKECWTTLHVNHDYMLNTAVYPHVHWSPNTTSTGTVRWGIEYTIAKGHDQEAFPASSTLYIEETLSVNKQYQHFVSEVSDGGSITTESLEPDSLVLIRVFRDGAHVNDTFPDAVFGWFVDIHYRAERLGTRNKAPNFYG